jgi:hypothetical protein
MANLEDASMKARGPVRTLCLAGALLTIAQPMPAWAQPKSGAPPVGSKKSAEPKDGQHDFDFEFGTWKVHIRRLLQPLTGSNEWADLHGLSVVHEVWGGNANLGELDVKNATTRIQGLSMRLYNPESRQWSIYWSNSKDGSLGPAMVGGFKNGRGEFYNQEVFRGAAIFVRFIFSDITPTSFRLEQAFSTDGGKTWEPNWIATFSRQKPARRRTQS